MLSTIALLFLFYYEGISVKSAAIVPPSDTFMPSSPTTLFKNFTILYQRTYANDEETARRFKIFQKNLAYINSLNAMYKDTVFGITKFADYTTEELHEVGMELPENNDLQTIPYTKRVDSSVPSSFDWRDHGKVTPVKDQGKLSTDHIITETPIRQAMRHNTRPIYMWLQFLRSRRCNSCYAFAALAVVESKHAIKTNISVDLSEQEILDCDEASDGCKSGYAVTAYLLAIDKGLFTEEKYPYLALKQDTCPTEQGSVFAKTIQKIKSNADNIADYIYTHGPVSTSVQITPSLYFYKGGLFGASKKACLRSKSYHTWTIIGFGEKYGQKYWIIKNSWGTRWGDQGYIYYFRGEDTCGIESNVFSVTV